jgi:putative solute:sodium symporter small subunit
MRVERTPNQAEPQGGAGPAKTPPEGTPPGEASTPADDKHWSPFSTARAKWAWGLMAVFTAIYFAVAILTSAEFADLAARMVLGLPLGFWLGIGVIIAGLIITRIYLSKVEG